MGYRRWSAIAAAAWLLGVALLSFLPYHDKRVLHTRGRFHSAGHCGAFFLAALLLGASTRTATGRALTLAAVALIAASVEFTQHLKYHLRVEWNDVVADLLGVTLAAIALALLTAMGRRRRLV